jgi:hypothetical protein
MSSKTKEFILFVSPVAAGITFFSIRHFMTVDYARFESLFQGIIHNAWAQDTSFAFQLLVAFLFSFGLGTGIRMLYKLDQLEKWERKCLEEEESTFSSRAPLRSALPR